MILTLKKQLEINSRNYDGVSYLIKVLTPIDTEEIFSDKDKTMSNSELVKRYCLSLKGVKDENDKEITTPSELLNYGGTVGLVSEIATEIVKHGFLSDTEKN